MVVRAYLWIAHASGRATDLTGYGAKGAKKLLIGSSFHMVEGGEEDLPGLGRGMNKPAFLKAPCNLLDHAGQGGRGPDITHQAAPIGLDIRGEQFPGQILLRAQTQQGSGDKKRAAIRQEIADSAA